MTDDQVSYSDYSAYLTLLWGKKPDTAELHTFISNQDLLLINRRSLLNDVYRITFANSTAKELLTDGIILGSHIQLHSQDGGHRFFSVLFEAHGAVEELYLILDATIESGIVGGLRTTLVQGVRLITIEDLVLQFNPSMYSLN